MNKKHEHSASKEPFDNVGSKWTKIADYVAPISLVAPLSDLTGFLITWEGYIREFLDLYHRIVYPVYNSVFRLVFAGFGDSFLLPNYIFNYLVIGSLFGFTHNQIGRKYMPKPMPFDVKVAFGFAQVFSFLTFTLIWPLIFIDVFFPNLMSKGQLTKEESDGLKSLMTTNFRWTWRYAIAILLALVFLNNFM